MIRLTCLSFPEIKILTTKIKIKTRIKEVHFKVWFVVLKFKFGFSIQNSFFLTHPIHLLAYLFRPPIFPKFLEIAFSFFLPLSSLSPSCFTLHFYFFRLSLADLFLRPFFPPPSYLFPVPQTFLSPSFKSAPPALDLPPMP